MVAAHLVLPAIVPRFLAAYPEVRLEVFAADSLVDVLAAGCDAGTRYEETAGAGHDRRADRSPCPAFRNGRGSRVHQGVGRPRLVGVSFQRPPLHPVKVQGPQGFLLMSAGAAFVVLTQDGGTACSFETESSMSNNSAHWRHCARRSRKAADQFSDPVVKNTMLGIALSYERLALRADAAVAYRRRAIVAKLRSPVKRSHSTVTGYPEVPDLDHEPVA